jgi:predicted ATPase/class 3 adenylate cyclase/DNA-binding CsgD family transcriptional regulator
MTAGIVTFLLTDVVASTRLWRESPAAGGALRRQAELIRACVARHEGVLPPDQGEGDSVLAVFARPADALCAALDAQRALTSEPWPDGAALAVRMAVHTGQAELDDGRYGGLALIRAARLRSFAHGAQVLISNATVEIASEGLPEGVSFRELGSVALPGFERPERVHQLCHADLPAAQVRLAPLRPSVSNALGHWPSALIGRERERGDVGALLDGARLVTITGAGGSGKTRLAHAVAEDRADRHADGVVWVELSRISANEQVAGAVVAACGLAELPGQSALEVLAQRLEPAEALLVLDNCEHLLAACAELVDAVLRACPGVRVLATSREPLGATGETSWRIPSLALPDESERDPERLLASDAARLFVERARAALADFALDADTTAAVARICRRLDGVPLALELAAARVRALSVVELCAGLDDRFRLLTGGARTAVARQRTLLASVEWSHDLLEPDERTLFRRLSVFAAPFSLEAAEAVAADESLDRLEVFDLLARLVDKSLVAHAGDRYRMLETLRQYALERADDAGELPALRDRHLDWCCRRASGWAIDREVTTYPLLDEVAAEAPDLIAALHWSLGGDRPPAIALLFPLGQYWSLRSRLDEARAIATRVLAAADPGSDAWLEALAPVASALVAALEIGWIPAARAALDSAERRIPLGVRGRLEGALSMGAVFWGREEGIAGLERSIEASRAAGSRGAEIDTTALLAGLYTNFGSRRASQPLIAWLGRNMPRDAAFGFVLDLAAANSALSDGQFETARSRLRALRLEPGARTAATLSWEFLALWTEDRALSDELAGAFAQARPDAIVENSSVFVSAIPPLLAGDLACARQRLQAGLGSRVFRGHFIRHMLAEIALAEGAVDEAEQLLAECTLDGPSFSWPRSMQSQLRALIAHARRNTTEAEASARAALALAVECERVVPQIDALEALLLAHADAGRLDEAARLLGAVDAFRERTGYRWRFPYLRRVVSELRTKLDASAVQAGSGLSLAEAVEYATRGRGARNRPERGWAGLTPMESRVVELVAEGLPNKEIAQKLFISLATVKTHLVHVYWKLELRTRAELAAAATRRGVESSPPPASRR